MNSECQKRWGGRPSKSYTAWLQAMGCRRSFTSSFTSLFLIYLGIFSGMYWRQMTHAQPLLRDPHMSRSLTNHSLAIQAFSEYSPASRARSKFPPSAARLLVVFGAMVASTPNPAFVLILAALAPPLADPHRPRPLLPEMKRLPLSVRARVPLAAHTQASRSSGRPFQPLVQLPGAQLEP